MEPISSIYAVGKVISTVKAVGDVISNDGDSESTLLPYALIFLASQGNAAATAKAAVPEKSTGQTVPKGVDKYLKDTGQVRVDVGKDVPVETKVNEEGGEENSLHFTTVDEKYVKFGHVQDLCDLLKKGEIPGAKLVYLALLDIIDAIDMGLTGHKITAARLEGHLHEQKVTVRRRVDQSEEIAKPQTVDTKASDGSTVNTTVEEITKRADIKTETVIRTDGKAEKTLDSHTTTLLDKTRDVTTDRLSPVMKSETDELQIEDQRHVVEDKRTHEVSVYVSENGNTPQLVDMQRDSDLETNSLDIHVEKTRRSPWERFTGAAVNETRTETTQGQLTRTTEVLDSKTGRMVLVEKQQENAPASTVKDVQRNWESGWISYVPLGSAVDLGLKHSAGFTVTTGEICGAVLDVGLTAASFGAGFALRAAAVGGAKSVAGNIAEKVGTKALASTAGSARISGAKATVRLSSRYKHLGKIFSGERINVKNYSTVHNPMKTDFCKSMESLKRMDEKGVNIKGYLRDEFKNQGKIGEVRAHQIETQFRGLERNGLFTPENRRLLAQGKSPLNAAGERLDLDHIVPQSLEQSLRADPVNLSFLGHMKNVSKSNHLTYRAMKKIHNYVDAVPNWRPSDPLKESMREYIAQNPNYEAGWTKGIV